jgi:predicted O-linked N-acetylglucosamine transferase (SPINDLY family)
MAQSVRQLLRFAKEELTRGEPAAAGAICDQVLAVDPDHPEALHLAGLVSACQGDFDACVRRLERAVSSALPRASWLRNLGVAYSAAGRWRDAALAFERSLVLDPADIPALSACAEALLECGQAEAALALYQRAGRRKPRDADITVGLARTLSYLRRSEEALCVLQAALRRQPRSARLHELLADVYVQQRQYESELRHARIASRLAPRDARLRARLGIAQWNIGDVERSLSNLRTSIRRAPGDHRVHSAYLNVLLHHSAHSGEGILEQSRQWADVHCRAEPPRKRFANEKNPDRKLRIGYLSGEFATLPSHFFLYPILNNHDHSRFTIYAYHSRPERDAWTAEFERTCDRWRDVRHNSDREIADMVRRDRIDILVDCSGHYSCNRLLVFAERPAPVQVTFPNYPATTGLSAVDYILTDEWTSPP